MERFVNAPRDVVGKPGQAPDVLQRSGLQRLQRSKVCDETLLADWSKPLDVIERRRDHLLAPQLTVKGVRKSVRLVTDVLKHEKRLAPAFELDSVLTTGYEHLFKSLRERCHRDDVLQTELIDHIDCNRELSLATVNQDELWWVGESTTSGG